MIRKLTDLAAVAVLLAVLLLIGLANLAGRAAWTLGWWPRRRRTP